MRNALAAGVLLTGGALVQLVACSDDSSSPGTSSGGTSGASSGATSGGGTSGGTSSGGTSGGSSGSNDGGLEGVDFVTRTVEYDGVERTYILQVPKAYDAEKSYPLVLAFHGNPSSAQNMINRQPFSSSGSDAIVAYPQARSPSGDYPGFFEWDIYTVTASNADMNWVKTLPDEIANSYSIDENKVFGFGYSGGGFFVTHFACRFGGVFRAISSHSGGGPDEEAMGFPTRPSGCFVCPGGKTPTLVTHGGADDQVDPGSGRFTAHCYAETNGCNDTRSPSTPNVCERYDGCPADGPVELCIDPQQGHDIWPNAAEKSWAFFSAFL